MKKKVYVLFIIILVFKIGFAQEQPKADKPSNTGRFYGRIIDASANKGLASGSVQLVHRQVDKLTQITKESLVDGMLTLKNGDFNFENVSLSSDLFLMVTALGFEKHEEKINVNQKGSKKLELDMDLGNIRLAIDPKLLETVTVSTSKLLMSLGIDRKVFNVEKSITSAGGTAEDVMRSVPSLSVDMDGNVTLRNSSPQIFVDGRPSTMSLEQIPADAIESVEIITNPSAKYDASGGGGGILNIVLKKNRISGYNGSLKRGIDQRGRYSFGADINVRQGKINMFASTSYRERKSISTGKTERLTILQNAHTQLYQTDNAIQERSNFFLRTGIDYLMDNRNTISVSGYITDGRSNSNSTSQLLIDSISTTSKNSSLSKRLSLPQSKVKSNGATIGYKHLFAKAGKEWTADINYTGSNNKQENNISTSLYNFINGPNQFIQQTNGSGHKSNLIFQTDYVNPRTKISKIELGARIQLKSADNRNNIGYVNELGTYTYIPQLSSNYSNKSSVFAGYGSFSNRIKKIGYQLGLRIESSKANGEAISVDANGNDTLLPVRNRFPMSLFPSIFLTQQLDNNQELQFSLTRRINRPDFLQLSPFTDYSDSLNLNRGNPKLKSEFTYSAELAYEKSFSDKKILLASAYFKYTNHLITRFQEVEVSPVTGKENLVSTFINANSSYTTGLEFIYRQSVAKWWEMTSNLNLFTTKINLDNEAIVEQKSIYSWFAKVNNTFKLPKNVSFEVTSEYSSRRVLPQGGGKNGVGKDGIANFGQPASTAQGYINPRLEVDAALRLDFLKNKKASLTFHVSDIFRTDASNVYSESIYFRQESYRLKDPQYFRLHFTWRFGKVDASLFKRKNNKAEENLDESEN